MTTLRQIEANRRNARRSTGPVTEDGKQRSRCNAVRHGLTAETVISALEDADDYKAFEASVTADYDAQSAVERELVLRLASLLWRIRRATTIETGLFELQARHLLQIRRTREEQQRSRSIIRHLLEPIDPSETPLARDLTKCFLRLANLPTFPLDRLSRYEAALWRQAAQTIFVLNRLHRPSRVARRRRSWATRADDWQAQVHDD